MAAGLVVVRRNLVTQVFTVRTPQMVISVDPALQVSEEMALVMDVDL